LLVERASQQVWLNKTFLGLRCDLRTALQLPAPAAKIPVDMQPWAGGDAFAAEAALVQDEDALEVYARQKMLAAGIQTAYVSLGPGGAPAYIQWLVSAATQAPIHALYEGRYRRALAPGEFLLEGAYTFTQHRGQGTMAAAQHQLLQKAAAAGGHTIFTYVASDNIPSLRGCAKVGFVADHVRVDHRRMRQMHSEFLDLTPGYQAQWDAAVAKK